DLEVRVLGCRADQRDHALLDAREERVLLRLVEPVDLVEKQDRPPAVGAEPLARAREHLTHLRDRRRYRRQLLERGPRQVRADPCERRLPGARRPVEDRRTDAVLLDRRPQRRAFAEHLLLAYELLE